MNECCDLYLVIPCSHNGKKKLEEKPDDLGSVLKNYRDIAEIVLTEQFSGRIHRNCLSVNGESMIFSPSASKSGEETIYPIYCAIQSQWRLSQGASFNDNQALFCTLTIVLCNVAAKDIMQILNSVAREFVSVGTSNSAKKLKDWLSGFALKKTAAIKTAVFSSMMPSDEDLRCILAAEKPKQSISLTSAYIESRASFNIAQYSSAMIFASDAVVLEIPRTFHNSFEERLFSELATIFVIEIHVQRIAFLGYFEEALDVISTSLNEESLPALTRLNNLVISAMGLWQTNIFRYILARTIYDEIGKAFRVEQNFKQLNDGKDLLEQLVGILKQTSDEKENKKLNTLLLFLATMQVFPFLNSSMAAVIRNEVTVEDVGVAFVSIVFAMMFYLIYKQLSK